MGNLAHLFDDKQISLPHRASKRLSEYLEIFAIQKRPKRKYMTKGVYSHIPYGCKSKYKIMLGEILFVVFLNGVKNKLLKSLLNSGPRVDSILRYYYSGHKQIVPK